MAKEITVESLADAIKNKGIQAAQEMIATQRTSLATEISRRQSDIHRMEAELSDLQGRIDMLETLVAGAVKKAAADMGIPLATPAIRPAAGKTTRMTQDQAEQLKHQILATINKNKSGVGSREIKESLGVEVSPASLSRWLNEMIDNGQIRREGERRFTKYLPGK